MHTAYGKQFSFSWLGIDWWSLRAHFMLDPGLRTLRLYSVTLLQSWLAVRTTIIPLSQGSSKRNFLTTQFLVKGQAKNRREIRNRFESSPFKALLKWACSQSQNYCSYHKCGEMTEKIEGSFVLEILTKHCKVLLVTQDSSGGMTTAVSGQEHHCRTYSSSCCVLLHKPIRKHQCIPWICNMREFGDLENNTMLWFERKNGPCRPLGQ